MPVIAAPIFWAAIASGGTALAAGKMASNAAGKAANQQTNAANHAADVQSKSAADVLAFNRQQAEADFQNSEGSRKANYDQWAASQRRLQTLNDLLGLGPREIPAYVPGKDPNFTGSGPGTVVSGTQGPSGTPTSTGTPSGPSAPVDGSPASISAYFKSKGVSDSETPYWVGKWPELMARGQEIGNPNYAMDRLAAADVFGGQAGQAAPYKGTVNSWLTPAYQRPALTTGLTMPGGY